MPYYEEENKLQHYGVKGMKWGIRRYQNKDGSLTTAGKTKYDNYKDRRVKTSSQREKNAQRHIMASNTIKSTKVAAVSAITALMAASVGSVGTYALAKSGRQYAATKFFISSKRVFNDAVFMTKISLGKAVISAAMTQPDSMKSYLKEEQRIRKEAKTT